MAEVSRNAPCPCGSGEKYKRCCLGVDQGPGLRIRKGPLTLALVGLAVAIVLLFTHGTDTAGPVAVGAMLVAIGWAVFTDPPPPKGGSGDPAGMNFGR